MLRGETNVGNTTSPYVIGPKLLHLLCDTTVFPVIQASMFKERPTMNEKYLEL